jgi:sulfoxide reductase catalytic subunit YedY
MLIKRSNDILSSEITSESVYLRRRELLKTAGVAAIGALASPSGFAITTTDTATGKELVGVKESSLSTDEAPNSWSDITTYNNYYEFGTGKEDPARNARDFKPRPWSVAVKGECDKPGTYNFEDLVSPHTLEERIYRLRCVEAWSMVVPWVGIPLASILKQFEPNSGAKYVRFKTLHDPGRMPGQRRRILDWPYEEGLTIAEAMHPLTIMAVGLYGRELPNQNGAPLRLVVPWKYGFKSIKAIAEISFTSKRPRSSWERAIPSEYGFYANVNPEVPHPRWSQARERPIGAGFFAAKKPTLVFNGYADQVASLYTGLDLRKNY